MPSEAIERKLQHDFCRARRPAALTLGRFEPFQETAYVDKQTRKFRTYRIERMMYALTRGNDGIRQNTGVMTA